MPESKIVIEQTPPSRLERFLPLIWRTVVWGLFFAIIYLLRSFFLLVFLTFVFAYVQANLVNRLSGRISNRTIRVIVVFVLLLGILISIGAFIVPRVTDQARLFADNLPKYLRTVDQSLFDMKSKYPFVESLMPQLSEFQQLQLEHVGPENWDAKHSPSAVLLQGIIQGGHGGDEPQNMRQSIETIRNIGGYLASIGSAFLLSLLFSFLIVLDLPKLSASVRELRNTKLAPIYEEVAESIHSLATVLGRALEAQLLIAFLNSFLTAIGIFVLGIGEKVAFLSVIVFLCSFIPVAGVFISSVPICLVALEASGLSLMFAAIVMITIIHLIEAYILNPKIYGHHLRMNPVIVLIILTIGGKMFHVWGLVLGVPICTYIFGHAIRRKETEGEVIL